MHDYFDILGVASDARPPEIRRACGRRSRPAHPDVWDGVAEDLGTLPRSGVLPHADPLLDLFDASIDFVDMAPMVDRMREGFFAAPIGRQKTEGRSLERADDCHL